MKLSHQLPILATALLLMGCSGYDQTSDSNKSDLPVAAREAPHDASKSLSAQPPPTPPALSPILASNAPTGQPDTNANPAPKPPSASPDINK
jgi:hypothetical protein